MDLHSSQIQGFFEIPADNIYSAIIYNNYFNETLFKNLTIEKRNNYFIVISPDAGATKRTLKFAKMMKLDMALMHKERIGPNQVENTQLICDKTKLIGKIAIICDDMCDTAGTLTNAINTLEEYGIKEVICVITHSILSGPAIERINRCQLVTRLIVSNSIPQDENLKRCSKLEIVPIEGLMSEIIKRLLINDSISELFKV